MRSRDTEIRALQQQAAESPHRAEILERLGWAFIANARETFDPGFYSVAESCARCILTANPEQPGGLLLLGHVHHSLHRFEDAERIARQLVELRGEWLDHGLLGDALMERGRIDEAAQHYQIMMDVRPGPQAYSRAAHIRWLRGDLNGAVDLMRRAVASVSPRDRESAAWMRTRLGRYLAQQGKSAAAEDMARRATAIIPDFPPALLLQGTLRLAARNCATAIGPLQSAAAANPLPDYQWALLEALESCNQSEQAARVRAALVATGARNDGRTTALFLASQEIDVRAALRLARRELAERADVHSYDAVAWALAVNGEPEAAYQASRSALAEGTVDARILCHAGVIAAQVGRTAEAASLLRRATDIDQMLLPSERARLARENARLVERATTCPETGINPNS